jgi:hypothetical protein
VWKLDENRRENECRIEHHWGRAHDKLQRVRDILSSCLLWDLSWSQMGTTIGGEDGTFIQQMTVEWILKG